LTDNVSQKIWGWLLLVTTFMQMACIFLTPSHVPQYQTFDTALSYLMFNLPLTKSSQQRKTASHCRTPMKIYIIIFILRGNNMIVLLLYW